MVQNPKPFEADIVAGHFERPGNEKVQGATETEMVFSKTLHFRKLDPSEKTPAMLTYLLFGQKGELFLAHLIGGRPDFDYVVAVSGLFDTVVSLLKNNPTVKLEFPNLDPKKPLKGFSQKAKVSGTEILFPITIDRDIYTEFGDLS
jgi:hypothetical protein